MPKAIQLSLKTRNEPGTLAKVCRELADRGVNLIGLLAPDTTAKQGHIRLVVANPELAQRKVAEAGYAFSVEEVLFVEIKNRPGALAKATEKLARAKINVRYAYATGYSKAQKTAAVIAVSEDDLPKAAKLLG